ncbi:E3 ubiquitin-protein ligase RMA1H1-like [Impatiens glandulifera]|uniref:E3 ubiquitin-protein ligase RMA1H1-like n=1 Tax=Impatiens glandulifera TaxID=253017 RepID=UPI001FB0B1A1|nr:E3 ubiquitin-protein ligase RMA1H1-like [Impatiens glandulifera]
MDDKYSFEGSVLAHDEYGNKSKCREDVNNEACGGFECNICLDPVQDAVVTICGHLYCWKCIYKWIHLESSNEKQCPVCKAEVSERRLIPLYAAGRGNETHHEKQQLCRPKIPPRPSSCSLSSSHRPNPCRQHRQHNSDPFLVAGGMNGEMIYERMFGNSISNRDPNSYGNGRSRYLVEIERSLDRLSLFLFCFVIYCLVLF